MAHVTLILGGARSGKSDRALALATEPRIFIATAQALDGEMQERIDKHQRERGAGWEVIEEPVDLCAALLKATENESCALVDCLTLWLSNLIFSEPPKDVEEELQKLLALLPTLPGKVIFVSNEIGLGLSPMEPLSRRFRDAQGRVNRMIAQAADHVEFVAAGLPMVLKQG